MLLKCLCRSCTPVATCISLRHGFNRIVHRIHISTNCFHRKRLVSSGSRMDVCADIQSNRPPSEGPESALITGELLRRRPPRAVGRGWSFPYQFVHPSTTARFRWRQWHAKCAMTEGSDSVGTCSSREGTPFAHSNALSCYWWAKSPILAQPRNRESSWLSHQPFWYLMKNPACWRHSFASSTRTSIGL